MLLIDQQKSVQNVFQQNRVKITLQSIGEKQAAVLHVESAIGNLKSKQAKEAKVLPIADCNNNNNQQ